MQKTMVFIFVSLFLSINSIAADLQTVGSLSLTQVLPAWTNYSNFSTHKFGKQELKTFTFKASSSITLSTVPTLTSSTSGVFSFPASDSRFCYSGRVMSTGQTCILQLNFDSRNITNGTYTANIAFQSFTLNISGEVSRNAALLKTVDRNKQEINSINFNKVYSSDNVQRTRTIFLQDFNENSSAVPSISVSTGFSLLTSCASQLQLMNTTGCEIQVTFDSTSKSTGTYTGTLTIGTQTVSLTAIVADASSRPSVPEIILTDSAGNSLSIIDWDTNRYNPNTTDVSRYYFVHDLSRVGTTNQSLYLDSYNELTLSSGICSPTNLKAAKGCQFSLQSYIVSDYTKTVGSYPTNLNIGSLVFPVALDLTNTSGAKESSNVVYFNAETGEQLPSITVNSIILTAPNPLSYQMAVTDVNKVHPSSTASFSTTGTSGIFNMATWNCYAINYLNVDTGCTFRVNISKNTPYSANSTITVSSKNLVVTATILGTTCTPSATQSCTLVNASSAQRTCNSLGSAWGNCSALTCNFLYHSETPPGGVASCVSNTRSCSDATGSGTETWSSSAWGPCRKTTCNSAYHLVYPDRTCDSNVRSCAVANGTGSESWIPSNSAWSACTVSTCDAGYYSGGNACNAAQRVCSPMPSYTLSGFENWNTTTNSYDSCAAASCSLGYTVHNNTCVNKRSCSVPNGVGEQNFSAETGWGFCGVKTCNENAVESTGGCILKIKNESLSIPNGTCLSQAAGRKSFDTYVWNYYCNPESIVCDNGYSPMKNLQIFENGLVSIGIEQARCIKNECFTSSRHSPAYCEDSNNFESAALHSLESFPDAKCMDGNPASFFIRKGVFSGVNKWVIHLEGGGACGTIPTATGTTNVCSSVDSYYKTTLTGTGDKGLFPIHSGLAAENPQFHSWNQVFVHYCSQDLWTGTRTSYNPQAGYYIMKAVFESLHDEYNLGDAENVVVAGNSAGGIAIYYYGDYLKKLADPTSTKDVVFLNDSGYMSNFDWGATSTVPELLSSVALTSWESVTSLTSGVDSNISLAPQVFSGAEVPTNGITTPMFLIQDQADWELNYYNPNILNYKSDMTNLYALKVCRNGLVDVDINDFYDFIGSYSSIFASTNTYGFMTMNGRHNLTATQLDQKSYWNTDAYFGGETVGAAFGKWYFDFSTYGSSYKAVPSLETTVTAFENRMNSTCADAPPLLEYNNLRLMDDVFENDED